MIYLKGVNFNYTLAEGKVISALEDINLESKEGEFVSLIGPNGSGKTTLARLLNGLLIPSSGKVLVDGLNSQDKNDLRLIRQRVGMVFQNPENQIITTSVEREIAFGLENLNLPYKETRERVEWALSAFQLWEYKNSPPHRLSGGEKQKVALAAVLAMRPKYLILDEPTSLLSPEDREMLNSLIKKLSAETKITLLNITQFPEEALFSQRIIVLDRGKIVLDSSPDEVFKNVKKLKNIGLSVPKSLELANSLKRRGFKFTRKLFKTEDLAQELLSLKPVTHSLPFDNKRKVGEQVKLGIPEDAQIKLEKLNFIYNSKSANPIIALKEVNLEIRKGEFVGLIGPTGSGKTTLAQHLNGLLFASSGRVRVNDSELKEKEPHLKKIRQKVGLVFQFPEKQLFEETVYEDIAFGPRNSGLEKEEVDRRVKSSLEAVGMDFESFAYRSPFSLSSGEQRRVAIAGVLALEPQILILDEPTAGLDFEGISRVKKILLYLTKKGITIILISHNLDVVAELCQRIIFLKKGRVWYDGSKTDFFKQADKLKEEGVKFPETVELSHILNSKGIQIRDGVYEIERLVEELSSIFGKGNK
jgi:energy-coupling factor transporter ATPase